MFECVEPKGAPQNRHADGASGMANGVKGAG